jgi:hypothetical protein
VIRLFARALVGVLLAALRERARREAERAAREAVPGRTTWHHEGEVSA